MCNIYVHNLWELVMRTLWFDYHPCSVVSCGGDGTFMEVYNGLIVRKLKEEGTNADDIDVTLTQLDTKIGVIPAGTGQINCQTAYGNQEPETATLNIVKG